MNGLILLLVFLGTAFGTYLIMVPSPETQLVRQRMQAIRRGVVQGPVNSRPLDEEMALPFAKRVLGPAMERFSRVVLDRASLRVQNSVRQKLQQAGNPMSPGRFLMMRLMLAGGAALLGLLLATASGGQNLMMAFAVPLILFGVGWRMPEFWLARKATERRKAIDKGLPDVLDLLSVSVEAGLGLDGAIQKVGEKFPEPISGEFRELLKEIRLGSARSDAMRALADRTALPDMRSFVAAVIQAEQLGVSIARVLKGQSEALRTKRKQKAEEKAMALPVKMLFPLIIFIFPTIFIVVLGPVIIALLNGFMK
ncbi:MAG: type II secretion system F family protein [Mycobacterium leprae]